MREGGSEGGREGVGEGVSEEGREKERQVKDKGHLPSYRRARKFCDLTICNQTTKSNDHQNY